MPVNDPPCPLAAFPSAHQSAERLHRAVARPASRSTVCAEKGESRSVKWGHVSAAQHREKGPGLVGTVQAFSPEKSGAAAAHSRRCGAGCGAGQRRAAEC